MKIQISWDPRDCGGVKAKDVLADSRFKVTRYVGNGLEVMDTFHTALKFEVADYGEAGNTVDEIQWLLGYHWKIFSRVAVSETVGTQIDMFKPLSEYVTHLEWKTNQRKTAMEDAIALLKDTANWFKDRRIAAIRRLLEEKL